MAKAEEALLSCWGRLKGALSWRRSSQQGGGRKQDVRRGSFRYDPLSYAQNFDDGVVAGGEEDNLHRGFSSRFAVPNLPVRPQPAREYSVSDENRSISSSSSSSLL